MNLKNNKWTYKEIVKQIHMLLEWHCDMAEDDEKTIDNVLKVFSLADIYVEGSPSRPNDEIEGI